MRTDTTRIINHAIKSEFVVTIKSMDLNKTISAIHFSLQLCCLDLMNDFCTRPSDFYSRLKVIESM